MHSTKRSITPLHTGFIIQTVVFKTRVYSRNFHVFLHENSLVSDYNLALRNFNLKLEKKLYYRGSY